MENIEIEFKKDKGPGVEVKKDWGKSTAKGTADDPVPVEQEPHHRVVFENQYVRVLDVVVGPGETTLFHRHSIDNIPIILTDADNKTQFAGKDWTLTPARKQNRLDSSPAQPNLTCIASAIRARPPITSFTSMYFVQLRIAARS